MMIHEVTTLVGKHRSRKRIGRGDASGQGGTSGRGHKGAKSRAGFSYRPHFEGGQMQFFRRIPKRGFTNVQFRTNYAIVNVKTLEEVCPDGANVNAEMLASVGVIRNTKLPLKILGEGDLTKKLNITAAKVSSGARTKIEKAGGTITEIKKIKWTRAAAEAAKKSK